MKRRMKQFQLENIKEGDLGEMKIDKFWIFSRKENF